MKSFLSKVVADVLKKQTPTNKLTFVLPSQRACVFIKNELIQQIDTTSFLPKIVSIETYIQELADFLLIDNVQLLFEFYNVYTKVVVKEEQVSFEVFSQWATIVLHDFNEIDSYLIDAEALFSNLSDLKKLDNWFQTEEPSQLSIDYLQFFNQLGELYQALTEKLKKNKFGYQGLVYREAIENLEYYINNQTDNHIVFVGFNALNKAEEQLIQELLNNGLASIYWDANNNMMQPKNVSGKFLRNYQKNWTYYQTNPFLWIDSKNTAQELEIIGAPKNISQLKYAGELLQNFKNFNKTALVLADENLLSLAINSLPNNIPGVNITMGYPLKEIPLANLFETIFKMYLNQQKFDKKQVNEFYFKDILKLLNNSFLNKNNTEILQKITSEIKKENYIFINPDVIKLLLNKAELENIKFVIELFNFPSEINSIIKKCQELILELKPHFEGIEKEYLFRFYQIFQQLETLNGTYNYIDDLKTFNIFYKQLLNNEKLSFQGEPLLGLQLMGMLETRTLDFDNVIITSLNEGILPAGKGEQSFIPFDIKTHFGLPTYHEKDAIFSYHFQRLIQRAKKVYLLYNSETDGYGSGEKSRFITQLEIENKTLKKSTLNAVVEPISSEILEINKTPEVIEKLKAVFKKGISPSALATYIYNPIQFYEQRVLGIYEQDEVEETIAANTMGTVIHEVLELLYKPFVGKEITEKDISNFFKNIDKLLEIKFNEFYRKGSTKTGKNKLIYEVCKSNIQRFLRTEKELISKGNKLKIIDLEPSLKIKFKVDGIDFPINIIGKIDRIDELNGVTRIIDYKTGKVEAKDLRIYDFSMVSDDYKYTKALQVMLYSLLFTAENSFNFSNQLEAGIISFKNLKPGFLKMNFSEKPRGKDYAITKEKLDEFQVELNRIVKEILNPEIPFIENKDLPF
ncbi:PD-(D/E)XK nuclease family protein [Lutibacter sp. TH_r2]|uniref:PD-(D/E)XK nuclease family protein n=1 Tax=Lutibacter sp. TH_r2 TaxID=3082083 RepID=UPI0029551F46|nr:PD-(D/E)XK nuclease family protein [Lutibacter sp. TH_r2]MDV7186470.1 PD-(D/E)XK nuclease family protein [Lutibacter sp. TH_r2]